jgi:hypothetical protein
MPESITGVLQRASSAAPGVVFMRLVISLLLGALVSWIYRRTTREGDGSFPTTLTLLTVLIAMVTQVIGDNVARAFSLVGALSIVRFRTVVRDTRDTTFVIFSVIVGMAVGSANLSTALIGLVVVGAGAFILARNRPDTMIEELQPNLVLSLRLGIGRDPELLLGSAMNAYLIERRLVSVSTAKQGISLNVIYEGLLRSDASAVELVSALNQIEGVQDVRLQRRGFDSD